jgi:hypothetical protein
MVLLTPRQNSPRPATLGVPPAVRAFYVQYLPTGATPGNPQKTFLFVQNTPQIKTFPVPELL